MQSEAVNGHAVPVGNANFKQPSIPNPNLPQKDPKYVSIDEKGSSFGRFSFEPRCKKTGLPGFQPGLTLTGLCSHKDG